MSTTALRAPARSSGVALVLAGARWTATLAGVFCAALMLIAFAPALTGAGTMIVTTGSMEPTIPVGSAVITRMVPASAIVPGDVVTFRHEGARHPFTHRVTTIAREADAYVLTTKGDANRVVDPLPLVVRGDVPRVERVVPFVGSIVGFARSPVGTLALLAIPIAGLTLGRGRAKERCPACGEHRRRRD